MKVKGIVTTILPEISGISKSGKNWRKKEVVIQYESGQYPKSIVFQMMNDAIDKFIIQQGIEYEFELDFEARQWNNRYFLQASCWKATPTQQPSAQPAEQQGWQSAYPPAQPKAQTAIDNNAAGDLPF